jgi:cob(I)alamin adenosyltransferase
MKVYTKTGDTGTTSLFGGTRVPKDHIRIESYGTVDELNSYIGLIRDQEMNTHYKEILAEIQDRLFTIGAILATPPEKEVKKNGELRLQKLGIVESDVEL